MDTQVQIAVNTAGGNATLFPSKQAVLLSAEDHQAFDALSTAFRLELHPTGPVERAIFSQIVLAAWNIERTNRLEAALAASGGIDPLLHDANAKTLDRIAIFRMRAERTFHKCLKELQLFQSAHPLDEPVAQNEAKNKMKNEPKVLEFSNESLMFVQRQKSAAMKPAPATPAANTKTAVCETNPIALFR